MGIMSRRRQRDEKLSDEQVANAAKKAAAGDTPAPMPQAVKEEAKPVEKKAPSKKGM